MSRNVWYASYGSNMQLARFMCYIAGGQAAGSLTSQLGCRDATLPRATKSTVIERELYFARQSRSWNGGGVAFLGNRSGPAAPALGRRYLITEEQLADVIKQECQIDDTLRVDYATAVRTGSLVVRERSWYGKLLYLGEQEGYPMFTFTGTDETPTMLNPPGIPYLRTIAGGLREAYGYDAAASAAYLAGKAGIRGAWSVEELAERLGE